MALVGTIRVGTIAGLMDSLKRTTLRADLTLRSGEEEGLIKFREGELESCTVDVLDGSDALDEMLTWSHGHFSLRVVDAETPPEEHASAGRHIMVVDDELGVRKLVETFLESAGYRVSVVSQGTQAVTLVEFCRPDVVLLDVMLTGLDGFDIARHLRQQYDAKQLPILMMSANHDYEAEARKQGFAFFGKPFDLKKLAQTIEGLFDTQADRAVAQRLRATPPAEEQRPVALTLPASLTLLLDVDNFLPDLDARYQVDEVAKTCIALAGLGPAEAAMVAALEADYTLRDFLDEDPDTRDLRAMMALLLHAVGALRPVETRAEERKPPSVETAALPMAQPLLSPAEVGRLVDVCYPGAPDPLHVFRVGLVGNRGPHDKALRSRLSMRRSVQDRFYHVSAGGGPMPRFTDDELDRIPLAEDALLIVHEAPSALNVEELIQRSDTLAWGLVLYFQGYDQLGYVLDLVPSLSSRFDVPVIAAGTALPEDEVRILGLLDERGKPHHRFHGVVLLEDDALDQALRTLLLGLASPSE
jgi:CheY-like chemotaxis protein